MKQEIEITLRQHDEVTLFELQGDLTAISEPYLKEAYENANHSGARNILLKFYQEAYINSGGIAILIQLLAEARKNNQQICITGLSAHFTKIFNMVGITKLATIYSTTEEALEAMAKTIWHDISFDDKTDTTNINHDSYNCFIA